MSDRAARVGALSAEQQALLMRRLGRRTVGASGLEPLPRCPGVNVFRASYAQERLWFLEQVAAGSAAYNVAGAFDARGRLDLAALRSSLTAVIARHESLRTTFVAMDGRPLQVISPVAPVAMVVSDLRRGGGEVAIDAPELGAEIRREVERPFDPSRGPLLRLCVFALGPERHAVVLTLHHLIADAWSMGVLVRELSELYCAAVYGSSAALAAPGLQYADYAEWQRRDGDSRRAVAAAYWRRQLAGAPYPAVAAGDRLGFRGAAVHCEFGTQLTAGIRALARAAEATGFAVALAAWSAVLARKTGLDDVTVLAPVANRERSELADIIGFFVNLIALRTRLDDRPTVAELVRRVGAAVRDGLRHQTLPFEVVLGELGVDRTLTRPPLSPFAFALERPVAEAVTLPGVTLTALPLAVRTSRTDLALVVEERGSAAGWRVRLEYDRTLYEAHDAAALLADFRRCLDDFVADPGRPAALFREPPPLPIASSADPTTVWGRFLAQAARTPDAVAVRAAGRTVTYEALRQQALALAAELAGAGVGSDDVVAFAGGRGAGWLRALLAIWGAGAVYLPLDPRWPPARTHAVLARSGARLVLADDTAGALPAELPERMVVRLDAPPARTAATPAASVSGPRPDDVAYVIFTSGSSGVPKGAVIEHAGLMNHLRAKIALLGLTAADRVAQTAPTSFDVSLWQALAPLVVGAEVVIVDDAAATDPAALPAAVGRHGITALELVPSVLGPLLDGAGADEHAALGSLRWLVVTGEALPPALCRRWLAVHPAVPLVNAYGPTECADDVTHHVVRTPPPPDAVRVPIGVPIPGMDVQVLDERLAPVPAGVAGELCVSGVGVGRGYLGDPVRTAAAFVTSTGAAPGRLYRTGDRGRRLADGTFEWLGRLDGQVKLGGVRIELDEVEAVLEAHPAVRRAAAAAVPAAAPTRLLAWVEAADGAAGDLVARLREWAAARLPAAMVPAAIGVRSTLPLTAHGKIDRRALVGAEPVAAADAAVRSGAGAHHAPHDAGAEKDVAADLVVRADAPLSAPAFTTATERLLAALWTEVLGVEVRTARDGFFALGGDSLATLRFVAAARRHGLVFTPQQVFETPMLAALAARAAAAPLAAEQGLVVGDLAPTPIQRLLLAADLPRLDHYNMALLLAVEARLEPAALAVAAEHLLRHHDVLRLRLHRDGEGAQLRIAGIEGPVPYTHVELAAADAAAAAAAIEARAAALQASLDLAAGPVIRIVSFDLGAARPSRLLVVVHHLACDAASWPILLEDLAALYTQAREGVALALPAKTTSYRAWAEHLAARAERGLTAAEQAFWAEQSVVPGARLPRTRPVARPAVADAGTLEVVLDGADTARLSAMLARRGATMEAALVTAVATAVAAAGGDRRVLLYLERHGRDAAAGIDVSRTVGWFTAVFPLAVVVAPDRDPVSTLAAVERRLRAVPAGGIGWGLAAFASAATAAGAFASDGIRPEVSCNYVGRLDPPPGLPWRLAPESAGAETAAAGTRPTMLDVVAHIAGARLRVGWHYDAVAYERAAIAALAAHAIEVLRRLALSADAAVAEPAAIPGRWS
ncbi:MAG: amino acid adenylation domain-containing protein [Myxococcales bacterium]|jgi:amino acid adenylation domain-containing protein/non-ribosomal peptide synthase protein (TIGR01720 family)|nr:amino acid adenylation domain-containing protein [Myxococcales bacterium]